MNEGAFQDSLEYAKELDRQDPLSAYRDRFHLPKHKNGQPLIYFCGNSLGLQPKQTAKFIQEELEDWASLGVEGHFTSRRPWFSYHELFTQSAARIVGTQPGEVVMMNSLTVNLHLMLVSFYRPTAARHKILMEAQPFPSDLYAAQSHLQNHGYDPKEGLLFLQPRTGETVVRTEDIESLLASRGQEIALFLLGGVNYYTGQAFQMDRLTKSAQAQGCVVGYDLAHAAGNLPMRLHDWNVDFAVWCTYKYLNAGPGGVGGCFVHERHGRNSASGAPGARSSASGQNTALPRLAGWWGNDPSTRFSIPETFSPQPGAAGWQLSNAPILPLAALKASLDIFDEVGMKALRTKSILLTNFLEFLLRKDSSRPYAILTPSSSEERGCQLSIRIKGNAKSVQLALRQKGVAADYRAPDVFRVAPVPLYNTFEEVWQFVRILNEI